MIKSVNIGFLYGMVIGLTIGLFKVPYKIVESGDGVSISQNVDFIEYIIPLLRVSLVIGIVGAIVGLGIFIKNKKNMDKP
ncbi:hypothetical protein [Gottfriedia luciferensis]|uniref:hypothetical protein n=1 Tax=Gottfriedia luciferensis TaxID=178774 RepID=UPI000B439F63|nr:hypothetical protein [Gottfriedia luciferensis]